MLKKILNIAFLLLIVVALAACGSTKKATQSKKGATATAKQSACGGQEYSAFFEAEKARIKGDKKRARTLYRDFVKKYKTNGTNPKIDSAPSFESIAKK